MTQLKIGDLVWIPDLTYAYGAVDATTRYNIKGPTYGIVLEINKENDPSKVRVSLGKENPTNDLWFRENEIYKEDGDVYGKIC
jgi:hypothetical protein